MFSRLMTEVFNKNKQMKSCGHCCWFTYPKWLKGKWHLRLGFLTKDTCHYAFGQRKGACSPLKGGGMNAMRYGSTLRHSKMWWK